MKFFVSGITGIETTLAVRGFPVTYYPVDYPFFGIGSEVSGSGYHVARALKALGDDIGFLTFIADDENGKRICADLDRYGIPRDHVFKRLTDTVETVTLQEIPFGRRQRYCDLKNTQDMRVDFSEVASVFSECDCCALMNVNFSRELLHAARDMGKTIATDVSNLTDINDSFNAEFLDFADILFLSDEGAEVAPEDFISALSRRCGARIIVMGLAEDGALCFEREKNQIYKLNAVNVGSVITNGAGAALFSGFLHFYGKYDCKEALKRAQTFAALTLLSGSVGEQLPDEAQVEERVKTAIF